MAEERGSTYVFIGAPDKPGRRTVLHEPLLWRIVRELPGIDIRVVANRAERTSEQ